MSDRRFSHFQTLMDGKPYGGKVTGIGISIDWQQGPLQEVEHINGDSRKVQNGAFVEDIIRIAKERLEFYQRSPFACEENHQAMVRLDQALNFLNARTNRRAEEGKEGTWQV